MSFRDDRDDDDDYKKTSRKMGTLRRMEASAELDEEKSTQFSDAISLSDEQGQAYEQIVAWFDEILANKARIFNRPTFTLGGYAGTGKTTLLGHMAADLCRKYRVAFCTLTGKAASILARSLRANGVTPEYCGTIHRMMYVPDTDDDTGEVKGWSKAPELTYDLIVVDEASMLSGEILADMKGYGIPILPVGDHGQLPPVGEDVGLMLNPDACLVTVRRQALEHPVIALSVVIRSGGNWRDFIKNCCDPRLTRLSRDDLNVLVNERFTNFTDRSLLDDPLILCGTNRTRAGLNKVARYSLKTEEKLLVGERVICLKNSYLADQMMLANGFRGRVTGFGYSQNPGQFKINAEFPDEGLELRDGLICKQQLGADKTIKSFKEVSEFYTNWADIGMLLDYGYALTVHKAQGSQADEVIGVVERFQASEDEFRRWLYTLVTRATKKLTVVL